MMNARLDAVKRAFENAAWFECREVDPGCLRICTPFTYPDGDLLDVFVVDAHGVLRVTDMCETARYLETCERWHEHAIQSMLGRSDIQLDRGEIYHDVVTVEDVPEAVWELIQGIERICGAVRAKEISM